MAMTSFERCMVFHSLSKRSSVPGLRSGFVAGDPALIKPYLLYRTYHGCAMPVPTQLASIAAWNDDAHAAANRVLYREKYARVLPILQPVLDVVEPDGAFYLWPDVHRDDEALHARLVRHAESDHPAWQLPRARHTRGQPRPPTRSHLAGRTGGRMCDRRAAHPCFPGQVVIGDT